MYILQQKEQAALGELNKIKERADKEVEQVSVITAAKTKAEEAAYYKQEQENLLAGALIATKVALEKEKQLKAAGRGGIDPLIRLKEDNATRVAIYDAMYKYGAYSNLTTVFGGEGGAANSSQMLDVMMSKQIGK